MFQSVCLSAGQVFFAYESMKEASEYILLINIKERDIKTFLKWSAEGSYMNGIYMLFHLICFFL